MKIAVPVFTAIALSATVLPARQDTVPAPYISKTQSGATIEMPQLVSELADCDVIFLGEQHDNDSGHAFQLQVIEGLFERGLDLVISTEQFERDVQGVVDDYASGRIDEDAFVANSRPWKNYARHYRPIIELAREKNIPVLAANVPRRLASNVAAATAIEPVDQVFLPRSVSADEDLYWHKFKKTMAGHMGADGDDKLRLFFKSQCLKDDAMAEAISDYLAINPHRHKVIVHLCGSFHSDYGLGTVTRLLHRRPLTRTAVVTMEALADSDKSDPAELRSRAHYIYWTAPNPQADAGKSRESVVETGDAVKDGQGG
jgi:uncharacterized iron-regulated protein